MVQRLRFRHAVVTCLAIYSAYAFGLTSLEGYPVERMITNNLIFGAIVVLALIASYSLEHELRLAYLLGLRERLRNRDLEVLSRHDALTGLDNRRSLEETLVRLGKSGGDGGIDLAIILADIDHFKSYNDSLGHLSGDVCLKRVAGIMQAELRTDGDMAFRFGGEEFLLLLPEADLSIAVGVAERIRRGIEDAAIPHPARVPLGLVTTSFGVAAAQLGGAHTADELIASADAALYAAKHNGRNQVWPRFAPSQPGTVIDLADRKSQIK
jgi:diguanylate cyclase (GGDEF)-like protein